VEKAKQSKIKAMKKIIAIQEEELKLNKSYLLRLQKKSLI